MVACRIVELTTILLAASTLCEMIDIVEAEMVEASPSASAESILVNNIS